MITRILVPLDQSELAERALDVAIDLARQHGASLRLVHVWLPQLESANVPLGGRVAGSLDEVRVEAGAYLERLAADAQARGVVVAETALLAPPAPRAIREEARDWKADLIVMSTHGRTGWSRVWLGSVADAVVREADTPVLLVRARGEGEGKSTSLARILVPIDGSPEGDRIIDALGAVLEPMDARVLLLTVVGRFMLPELPTPAGLPVYATDEEASAATQRAEQHLDELAARLRNALPRATIETSVRLHVSPARAIVEAAQDADLVAMVPRTHGATRFVLGSVTDKVLRGSDASFLVAPPPREKSEVSRLDEALLEAE